jgi:hypothetical protein
MVWLVVRKSIGAALLCVRAVAYLVFGILLFVIFCEAVMLVITNSRQHLPETIGLCIVCWMFRRFLQCFNQFFDWTVHRFVPEWEEENDDVVERLDVVEQDERAVS